MKQSGTYEATRGAARFSVAPMMDWTDRHCRYLHRLMSKRALLYTEMVTAPALVRGGALHLLEFDRSEHPVAVQLGGSDPSELAQATALCNAAGYDEVNLNVGCPSDRVQSGTFGAVLMRDAHLVARCASAMMANSDVEITVKCRIGVDDQVPSEILPEFLETVAEAGISRFAIHARKAWLQGLSPKQNRDVPPLDYELVYAMKAKYPELHLSLNGGVENLTDVEAHFDAGMDGVMVGRAAYQAPCNLLLGADRNLFGEDTGTNAESVVRDMMPYIENHLANGGRLNQVTRHMLGLFAGRAGARAWRRALSDGAHVERAGPELLVSALEHVMDAA